MTTDNEGHDTDYRTLMCRNCGLEREPGGWRSPCPASLGHPDAPLLILGDCNEMHVVPARTEHGPNDVIAMLCAALLSDDENVRRNAGKTALEWIEEAIEREPWAFQDISKEAVLATRQGALAYRLQRDKRR